jgi:hypothetical protein
VHLPPAKSGARLEAPPDHRLVVGMGTDVVGIGARGVLVVGHVDGTLRHLRIDKGRVACRVTHRAEADRLRVSAGRFTVTAVGTRFLVRVDPRPDVELEVAVQEGLVEVAAVGFLQQVPGGSFLRVLRVRNETGDLGPDDERDFRELLLQGAGAGTPPPAQALSPPPLETKQLRVNPTRQKSTTRHDERQVRLDAWRELVVSGNYAEAESALSAHLANQPRDVDAWLLLGDTRRKAGNHAAAVDAYRKVIALPDRVAANQARMLAATLLQDTLGQPREAAVLLLEYVGEGQGVGQLRATALVRLGRAHLQLGELDRSRAALERTIREHPDTPAAAEAQDLLGRLR